MVSAQRIRHKELRKLFEGKPAKIDARWKRKIERILAQLNIAVSPHELTLYHCHPLKGDRIDEYALRVSANWRMVFRWDDDGPYDLDLEDYHAS